MSTPPTYLKSPPTEFIKKLDRISCALSGKYIEKFKRMLRCEGLGCGLIERNTVNELLLILYTQRKITPDKFDILIKILKDIGKAELIQEEFPESYKAVYPDVDVDSKIVRGDDLDWLAAQQGPEWESFARQQLEIPDYKIEQCKADVGQLVNLQQQQYKVLEAWKIREEQGATYDALTSKLRQCEDYPALVDKWIERLRQRDSNVKK